MTPYLNQLSIKRCLSKKEIATAFIILKVRHKLTTRAVSDICRLLNLLKVSNAPKSFPAIRRLIEHEALDNIKPDVLNICQKCNNVYKDVCNNARCQQDSGEERSPTFLKLTLTL